MAPMLQVSGLVKIYGSRRVVDGVDFEVYRGEVVGLLEPNGGGKTTSFRMTCGMIEANAGKVVLGGTDVTHMPMYRRCRSGGMGYLAQESSVFRKLSVQDNLLGVMEMLGMDAKRPTPAAGSCCHSSASRSFAASRPCRSPAASGGGWRSPGPWSPVPRSFSWTSRSRK